MVNEKLRIAQHEAGHAVVTLALGVPLVRVTMTNTKGFSDHGDMSNLPEPERRRRKTILCAAGRHSQIRWNPETNGCGCDDDNKDIEAECSFLETYMEKEGKKFHRDTFKQECLDEAEDLVAKHCVSIDLLVKKLLEYGALTGDEAAKAIGWQNPQFSQMAKKYRFRFTAYALFFLAGAVVAFGSNSDSYVQLYIEAIILVPLFGIPACVLALINRDPLLKLLAVGTALLFGFQILYVNDAGLSTEALNLYARLFAASCLLAPLGVFVGLVFSTRKSRT